MRSQTPYCRTKWPCESFWSARCHRVLQNDTRTLKRSCSNSPRSHQWAPKWHSGLPQGRHGLRKCCSRPPQSHQCTQKCCPGLLQSRRTTQKHSPSPHHSEKNCSISFVATLRSKVQLDICVFCFCVGPVFVSVSLFPFAVVFVFTCVFSVMSVEAIFQKYSSKVSHEIAARNYYSKSQAYVALGSDTSLWSLLLRAWICTGSH